MLKLPLLALTSAAAIALAASAPAPVQAGALHLMPGVGSVASESNVVEVQRWRRDRRHHHGRRGDRDALIALGIGSAIVGGMIAAQRPAYGYGPGPAYASSAWDQCAAQYRSLRADGTYTTYDGRQVLCPYLR
jgi:hypothetical protein